MLFGPAGIVGGGERYPFERVLALAAYVGCELVSFGRAARTPPSARVWARAFARMAIRPGRFPSRCPIPVDG